MNYKVIFERTLISVITLLLTLFVVDYLSIWLLPTRAPIEQQFPVELFRRPQPYIMFGGTPHAEFETEGAEGNVLVEKLNSFGYRGAAPELPKPPGEYRIFMLGGSTVFLGDPPIPQLLEEEFKRNGFQHVRVYNWGVISSVSGMELSRIVFEISELEPDLIVMYNGGNDLIGPFRQDPRPGYPFNFLVYENNPLLESNIRSYPTFSLLLYGSNLARYFLPLYFLGKFADIDEVRTEVRWGSNKWEDHIARTYVNNLVKADKISKSFGADFIAFAQPLVYYKDRIAPEEEAQAHHGERRPYALEMREKILGEVAIASEKTPTLKVVNLTDVYDKTEDWIFTDNIHTTQASKPLIAQEMYTSIFQYFEGTINRSSSTPQE
jgi:hypothetical protein